MLLWCAVAVFSLLEYKSVLLSSYFILQLSIRRFHSLHSKLLCHPSAIAIYSTQAQFCPSFSFFFFSFSATLEESFNYSFKIQVRERFFLFIYFFYECASDRVHSLSTSPFSQSLTPFCSLPTVALATEMSWKCMMK